MIKKVIDIDEKDQIVFWLNEFVRLSNSFSDEGNLALKEYWKGQVMGMSKIIDLLKLDIDTKYYLDHLH